MLDKSSISHWHVLSDRLLRNRSSIDLARFTLLHPAYHLATVAPSTGENDADLLVEWTRVVDSEEWERLKISDSSTVCQ